MGTQARPAGAVTESQPCGVWGRGGAGHEGRGGVGTGGGAPRGGSVSGWRAGTDAWPHDTKTSATNPRLHRARPEQRAHRVRHHQDPPHRPGRVERSEEPENDVATSAAAFPPQLPATRCRKVRSQRRPSRSHLKFPQGAAGSSRHAHGATLTDCLQPSGHTSRRGRAGAGPSGGQAVSVSFAATRIVRRYSHTVTAAKAMMPRPWAHPANPSPTTASTESLPVAATMAA